MLALSHQRAPGAHAQRSNFGTWPATLSECDLGCITTRPGHIHLITFTIFLLKKKKKKEREGKEKKESTSPKDPAGLLQETPW